MSNLNVRGFVTASGIDSGSLKDGHSSSVTSKVGGRVDYRAKVDRFNFVVSGTDTSARDYESVPNIKDAVITADTHHEDLSVGFGYDAGTQGFLASVGTSEGLTGTNLRLGGKDVSARGACPTYKPLLSHPHNVV